MDRTGCEGILRPNGSGSRLRFVRLIHGEIIRQFVVSDKFRRLFTSTLRSYILDPANPLLQHKPCHWQTKESSDDCSEHPLPDKDRFEGGADEKNAQAAWMNSIWMALRVKGRASARNRQKRRKRRGCGWMQRQMLPHGRGCADPTQARRTAVRMLLTCSSRVQSSAEKIFRASSATFSMPKRGWAS